MPKKISIVLGLALVLVMASVSMAYAAANSGYATWDTAAGDNGSFSATPHKNYTTATVKCAVCHAVHKANAGGELLLRGTAGASCEFCHISDNIGLIRLYGGAVANYTNPSDAAHTDNASGAAVGSRCTDCHAIHGANTLTAAAVDKFILKSTAAATGAPGGQSAPQAAAAAHATATGLKADWVDAFCSECHPYYQTAYNGQITVAAYHAGGPAQNGTFQSHIMGPANVNYANPQATYTGQVAWVGSDNCRSCHDAGLTDQQSLYAISLPGTIVTQS